MDVEWISNEVSTVDNPLDALVTRDVDSVYEARRRRATCGAFPSFISWVASEVRRPTDRVPYAYI